MFRVLSILFFIIFSVAIAKSGYSDIYIEEKITTTSGGNTTQGIKKTYLTKNKTLLQDPALQAKIIFDYNTNKVYSINDQGKDISVYPIDKYILPASDFYSDFVNLNDSNLYIRESGKKKQVAEYSCFEIVIYIPRIAAMTNLWLSSIETPLNDHITFFERYGSILTKKILPIMSSKNACIIESATVIVRPKEPEKYLKSELLKISIQDIPDSVFNLPEDYRIVNYN
jgi:hypothetical protein